MNLTDSISTFSSSPGPLVGKYLSIWGVKAIFPAGFIIDGGTFILFGLLQWVTDTTTFLLFSYLIRFLEVASQSCLLVSDGQFWCCREPELQPPGPQISPS